jgi:Flp pilus assembly protein TadD
MTRTATRTRMIALVASTALATMALGGCATQAAPPAQVSASKAEALLAKGKAEQAVEHAEAAVRADPRNAAYRAMLGAAYMEAGRFQSAATSFDDAMALGDESPRTALSYALAVTATGNTAEALAVLDEWRDEIPAADLGLAVALAGRPDQGAQVLANALRGGENTPKVRQNLAYAFALGGNWLRARIMAAEDVPADQLDARLEEWARTARPENQGERVAALLQVPLSADSGQPVELALANNPGIEQLAAEAAGQLAPAPAPRAEFAAGEELPAVSGQSQMAKAEPAPASFAQAFAEPAPAPAASTPAQMVADAVRFFSQPVVQATPVRHQRASAEGPRRVSGRVAGTIADRPVRETAPAPRVAATGDHLVQLGSFSSEAGAKRAWGIYAKRYPQLSQYDMVITEAVVRGKKYWRVSAGGLARTAARSVCATVQAGGNGCIAWAEGRPLPGAVDRGVRVASR